MKIAVSMQHVLGEIGKSWHSQLRHKIFRHGHLRYTLSHGHLTTDVAALVSSTAVGAWVAAKAGVAMLIDHGMATMGYLDGELLFGLCMYVIYSESKEYQ